MTSELDHEPGVCNDCVLSHSGICGPCRERRIRLGLPFMTEPEQEAGTWGRNIMITHGITDVRYE